MVLNLIKNSKWMRYVFVGALLLNILCIIGLFNSKNLFHVDELFSFAHANSTQGAFLVKGIDATMSQLQLDSFLHNKWWPGEFFHTWLTVQPDEAFKYSHIVENLKDGVHPPLFYILLHTVCSFTPDVLSKWSGFALNIILWVILLWAVFRLARLFVKDSFYAGCIVLFYAYSQVGLSTVLFIRGYLLQTVLAVGFMYQITRLLQDNRANWKRCLKIGILAVLGMLTHYNFIVFTALTGIITGAVLCWRKQWQLCVRLGIVLSASFVCFLLLFPPAIDVMLVSCRGRELITHYQGGIWTFVETDILACIMNQYLTWLWHGTGVAWYLVYVAAAGVLVYKYKLTKGNRLIDWLLCVAVGMWIYTNFSMPQMHQFSIRYSMLIFPLVAIGTVWYLVFCINRLVRSPKDTLTKWIVAGIILVNSWAVWGFKSYSPFAFYDEQALSSAYFANKKVMFTYPMDLSDKLAYAKQVFTVSRTTRKEQLQKALEEADFLIDFRYIIKDSFTPQEGKSVVSEIKNQLKWVRRFHSPTYEYDLYIVKPRQD